MIIEIDAEPLTKLDEAMKLASGKLGKEVDAGMEYVAERIRQTLYELTPKRTGFTAEAWTVLHVGSGEFFITNANEPIITFLSEGTVEHEIAPVRARALHWVDEAGIDRFSMGHRVLGIEPLNLEERALEENADLIDQIIDAAEDAAFRRL